MLEMVGRRPNIAIVESGKREFTSWVSDPAGVKNRSSSSTSSHAYRFEIYTNSTHSPLESPWGTGPSVEIPDYHTHFIVDTLALQDRRTHYLLESNRDMLFHSHGATKEWKSLKAMQVFGGNGSELTSLPNKQYVEPISYSPVIAPRRASSRGTLETHPSS